MVVLYSNLVQFGLVSVSRIWPTSRVVNKSSLMEVNREYEASRIFSATTVLLLYRLTDNPKTQSYLKNLSWANN